MDEMVDQMPARLFEEWLQYFEIRSWEADQHAKKQQAKSKARRR